MTGFQLNVIHIYEKGQIKIPPENTRTPISLWTEDIYSNVSNGTNKLKELFGDKCPFDFSKSVYTVKDLLSLNTNESDIVLDFFSGFRVIIMTQANSHDGYMNFIDSTKF